MRNTHLVDNVIDKDISGVALLEFTDCIEEDDISFLVNPWFELDVEESSELCRSNDNVSGIGWWDVESFADCP